MCASSATRPPRAPMPEPAHDALEALRARLAETRAEAERLAADIAAAGTDPAGDGAPPPPRDGARTTGDLQAVAALLETLRDLVPPELQQQLADVTRQILLLLRALIDVLVDRLEAPAADRPPPPRRRPATSRTCETSPSRSEPLEPVDGGRPHPGARVEVVEVPVPGAHDELGGVAARPCGSDVPLARPRRDDVVVLAVHEQLRDAERQPRRGRRVEVVRADLVGVAAHVRPDGAAGAAVARRELKVRGGRLADRGTDAHAAVAGAGARGEPERELPARAVTDRDDAIEAQWCVERGEPVERRRDVLPGPRPAAAGPRPDPAVLGVPHRPAAFDEVLGERGHLRAVVLLRPEPAMQQHGDGISAGRDIARGEVEVGHLVGVLAVLMRLGHARIVAGGGCHRAGARPARGPRPVADTIARWSIAIRGAPVPDPRERAGDDSDPPTRPARTAAVGRDDIADAASGAATHARRGLSRVLTAWRELSGEYHLAALASIGLFLTMFLPWYEQTATGVAKGQPVTASNTLSAFQAFSWVEAAVLVVSAAVLLLCFTRGERRSYHLPGGDGAVILAGGIWVCVLVFIRQLDHPQPEKVVGLSTQVGVHWGIFVTFLVALLLAYAGLRLRHAHRPEPGPLDEAIATGRAPRASRERPRADVATRPPEDEPTRAVPDRVATRVMLPDEAPTRAAPPAPRRRDDDEHGEQLSLGE